MNRRRSEEGFTLIELTVSLVAGLIVALGVIGISHEANVTFHEETRTASAEAALRVAVDRVRMDLQRAAFMSTGNIVADPFISHRPGRPNNDNIPPAALGLLALSGVRVIPGGSFAATPLSAAPPQTTALAPDVLILGGNYTSSDEFVVRSVVAGGGCGGQRITLEGNSAAMWRIAGAAPVNAAQALAALQAAFMPDPTRQWIVRFADETGHYQYAITCAGASTITFANGPLPSGPLATIDLAPGPLSIAGGGSPILNAAQLGGTSGLGGLGVGQVINPVQLVEWRMIPATALPATYAPLNAVTFDANAASNYVLTRTFLDATGAAATSTLEVVAEYVVDFKIALSVDTDRIAPTPGAYPQPYPGGSSIGTSPGTGPNAYLALDDATNNNWDYDVSTTPNVVGVGPQRIRSARVRLMTRSSVADRQTPLPPPPYGGAGQTFLYRYSMNPAGGAPYARVRTVVTETALPNQARMYY